MQSLHAPDGDAICAGAFDLSAHGLKHHGQVHHLGLAGCVFDDGGALGQAGRHHEVLGTGDGDHVGRNAGTLEPTSACLDVAMVDLDLRPHGGEALMCWSTGR